MEELYNYYLTNTSNSNELINYFKSAWKVISAPNGITIANKSGWSDNSLHDAAIVFDDNPYVLDGTQWELTLEFSNGRRKVCFYGNNKYPWCFDKLTEFFGCYEDDEE